MSTDALEELLKSNNVSPEFLLGILKDIKKKPKGKKVKKEKVVEVFTGRVTYTCKTCNASFDREYEVNKESYHIKMEATCCCYCRENLDKLSKGELIDMIIKQTGGRPVC